MLNLMTVMPLENSRYERFVLEHLAKILPHLIEKREPQAKENQNHTLNELIVMADYKMYKKNGKMSALTLL